MFCIQIYFLTCIGTDTSNHARDLLETIPNTKQKDALTTQIKYRKFVLGTKIMDKGLLQLQSGKEKFTTEQLKENLESVLQGLVQSQKKM